MSSTHSLEEPGRGFLVSGSAVTIGLDAKGSRKSEVSRCSHENCVVGRARQ